MVITRKIQVYVCEADKEQKKNLIHTVYEWRDLVRRAANKVVSHKFVQENVREFTYLKDEIKEKFYVKDLLKEGRGMSEQNTTYHVLSDMLKGKVPSDVFACLNQTLAKTYKETASDINTGKASLRTYKNNIPIPFSAKAISNIHWHEEDKRFYFTLFGVPFACALGSDRSNNQSVIERCIGGEYKICSSSLQIDDNKKKMFLLLCVDIPKQETELDPEKEMLAWLDIDTPITYAVSIRAKKDYDSGLKKFTIGTREEFFHRRTQIQAAVTRLQAACKYNEGGKGRKSKLAAIDRFHKKEDNYVTTKLHLYSRLLVDAAVKHHCGKIVLMDQSQKEQEAKENELVLRNWSYYGLKDKITYKAKMYGITVEVK